MNKPTTLEEARQAGRIAGPVIMARLAADLHKPAPTPEEAEGYAELGALAGERLFVTGGPWNLRTFVQAGRESVA